MRQPRGLPVDLDLARVVGPQHGRVAQQRAAGEDHHGGHQARQVLAQQQHLPPDGRQEPEVQRLVQHVPSEQVHENAQAAEENGQPQVEILEQAGKHLPVFLKIEERADALAAQHAVFEPEIGPALAVEVPEPATLLTLLFPNSGLRAFSRAFAEQAPPVVPFLVGHRRAQAAAHRLGGLALLDAVEQRRRREALGRPALAVNLGLDAVPDEDHGRKQSQQINPERALGEKGAPQLDPGDGAGLPGAEADGRGHRPPPIRYS